MFYWNIKVVGRNKKNIYPIYSFESSTCNPFTYYTSKYKINVNFLEKITNKELYEKSHSLLLEILHFHDYDESKIFIELCKALQDACNTGKCWRNSEIIIELTVK